MSDLKQKTRPGMVFDTERAAIIKHVCRCIAVLACCVAAVLIWGPF